MTSQNDHQSMTPQACKILEILQDGQKHCPIDWRYADGHGKRLTDINRYLRQFGKTLAWDWCDCGRHTTKIKMRWITAILPDQLPEATQVTDSARGEEPVPKTIYFMSNPQKPLF